MSLLDNPEVSNCIEQKLWADVLKRYKKQITSNIFISETVKLLNELILQKLLLKNELEQYERDFLDFFDNNRNKFVTVDIKLD